MSWDKVELRELISEKKIQDRTAEIGKELTEKFAGKKPVFVCVLKGAFIFFSDLIRNVNIDMDCDFLRCSSYGDNIKSTEEVKMILDVSTSLKGRDVVIVEDIVDTGITLNFLVNYFKTKSPSSVTTVSLLKKPDAQKVPYELDYFGFEIPNEYVVGYGLDYQNYFRHLPHVAIMSDSGLN